jgi:hypothetical protein
VTDFRATRTLAWAEDAPKGVDLQSIFLGQNTDGLGACEVATLNASQTPTRETLRELHKKRKAGRNVTCLVIAAEVGDKTYIFGPDDQTQLVSLPTDQARRVLQAALDEPSSRDAYTRFATNWRALESTGIAGFTNNGLFASYHIRVNVVQRADWSDQCSRSVNVRDKRHLDLIKSLGFTTETTVGNALVLSATGQSPRAVAVLLDDSEHFDSKSAKYQLSPVAWGLNVATKQQVPWLIVLRKDQIRLYPGKDGVGVGNKGQVETFFEMNLTEIDDAHVGLLSLIFSADALAAGGSADQLLAESQRYAVALGERLRERIYEHVVPGLAIAIADQLPALGLERNTDGLQVAYRLTLRVLFRLLFQAYAEDRGLLPSGRNELYDANSLKTIATRIQDADPAQFGTSSSFWKDLTQIWDIIDEGNESFQVPAYNGGLFGRDPLQHPEGALIERLRLTDNVLGPALQHLVIDNTEDDVRGQVDFRSLSVREFGTIYEGLLESSLSITDIDLAVDKNGAWIPASAGTHVDAPAGTVYFHSASGERKATGSYFTPSFIVDHLISRSLDPALDAHLARIRAHLDDGNHGAAARDFFDIRIADLAMGSGHFLVAAVDRIESKMRSFLTEPENEVPGVTEELLRLAETAKKALGRDEVAIGEIEPIGLLRRQVARRCIYGLDINPLAVELTRLALWIHTFVPGLPMSSLDHGLVCANSLTGIGTIEEAKDALQPKRSPGQVTFLDAAIESRLESLRNVLVDVANASEADKKEVHEGAAKAKLALEAAEPARRIFDLAVAARLGKESPAGIITVADLIDEESLVARSYEARVQEAISGLNPAHMPFMFPEVFLRENGGFDVLIGNPPWEKVKIEEDVWWGKYLPGFRALSRKAKAETLATFRTSRHDLEKDFAEAQMNAKKLRAVLLSSPHKGLGKSGDPDLYQLFAWKFWQLLRNQGVSGIVLPRTAMSGSGLSAWRNEVIQNGGFAHVDFGLNTGHWMFEAVHGQYSVALVVLSRDESNIIRFSGPHTSLTSLKDSDDNSAEVDAIDFLNWSSTALFPLIPSRRALSVFKKMYHAPRFSDSNGGNRFRPTYELHAAADKSLMEFDTDAPRGRVPVWGGSDINIWSPSSSGCKAYSRREVLRPFLENKLARSQRRGESAYSGVQFSPGMIPMDFARIAFRMVTNQTNSRTMICCLLPPGVTTEHSAQLVVTQSGGDRATAWLLAVMSSIPFDWITRRWVEINMTFELLNNMPVPIFASGDSVTERIIELGARLGSPDERFEPFARGLGVTTGSLSSDPERSAAISELDALIAISYGLDTRDIETVFETFHRGWDYSDRLEAVLQHFEYWSKQK